MAEDHAGKGGRQHQDHQPRDTGLPRVEHAGTQVWLVRGQHSRHTFKVLGGLFFDNVHSVVNGDDTHQTALLVHHRHGKEVVTAQCLCHFFLVVHGGGPDKVGVHQVFDEVVLLRQQQVADGQHAQQLALGVGDVEDVDGLHVAADAADALEGVRHRHVLFQGQKLHVHDGAGGILRVLQDLVQGFAHFRRGFVQNTDDHAGGHLLNDVHGVVQIQLVQHFLQLGVGEAVDEHLLTVALQLDEDFRRQLLGQQAVQQGHVLLAALLQQPRDIGRLQRQEQVTQHGILFTLDKGLDLFRVALQLFFKCRHEFGDVITFKHGCSSFPDDTKKSTAAGGFAVEKHNGPPLRADGSP